MAAFTQIPTKQKNTSLFLTTMIHAQVYYFTKIWSYFSFSIARSVRFVMRKLNFMIGSISCICPQTAINFS